MSRVQCLILSGQSVSGRMTIYYRENGAQSEIIIISYSDPDGGGLPDPDPNNTEVDIVALVGDITSESVSKMISGDAGVAGRK